MAEEVRDASSAIPKAMVSIWLVNSLLALITFITVAYHLPAVDEALDDPTLQPIIYILRQSMSTVWLTVLLTLICFILVCTNVAYLAGVTRDIWAFARDQGFPFSNWLSKIDQKRYIPVNATIFTTAFSACLSLIYIGSPVAYFAMTSLFTCALLQCYGLSIGCILYRRIYHPGTLPPSAFSLGRFGIPINIAAVCYSLWAFFWIFWPIEYEVDTSNFNWASVILAATLILASIHFVLVARRKYFGPVTQVRGRSVEPKGSKDHSSHA
jgi:choline transport protein